MDDDQWNDKGFEIMETEQEKEARLKRKADALTFSNFFAPCRAQIAKERKTKKLQMPPSGVKTSRMSQGTRASDVFKATLQKRVDKFHGLIIRFAGLWCSKCNCGVGSSASASKLHKASKRRKDAMEKLEKSDNNARLIQTALLEFKKTEEKDGSKVAGLQLVPVETQIFRAEAFAVFVMALRSISSRGSALSWRGIPGTV